jgi:hypothetical protein
MQMIPIPAPQRASKRGVARVGVTMGIIASLLGLFGCDQQKVDEAVRKAGDAAKGAWDASKPDSLLFKDIRIGESSEADVRTSAGKPEIVWEEADGAKRLEYPRSPQGGKTWMVDIGADGRVASIQQVLTAENFARVRPGMNKDDIRRLLGKPTEVNFYRLKQEEVWGWRWWESTTETAFFNVHFNTEGVVVTTSRNDAPERIGGG